MEAYLQQVQSALEGMDEHQLRTGAAVVGGTAALLGVLWYYYKGSKKYNFPPAPPGKFLLGNASDVADNFKNLHTYFTDLSKKYGDIFSLNMIGQQQLVLSGVDVIREITLRSPDFNNRPSLFRIEYIMEFEEEITFGKFSPKWIAMKKTALSSLKTYSDGLKRVESISHQIIEDLLQNFEEHKGESFSPRWEVRDAITNFMSWLTYGEGMSKDELVDTRRMSMLIAEILGAKGIGGLLDLAPWLRFIPNECMRNMREVRSLLKLMYGKRMKNGQARYDENDVKCALDVMIQQQPSTKLTDKTLQSITVDMIGAGTDTTSNTLSYFMAVMCHHPEIQEKAQKYIDEAIGGRLPLLSDKPALPYIEALGWETLRLMCPGPIASRCAMVDTTFQGFHVPKNTMVWINFWKMHHDETFWDKPFEFRPERFLEEEGNTVPPDHPNRTHIMPFGAGRRVCLGETLARNRLFLFMTALLQRFTFLPGDPVHPPPSDPRLMELGLLLSPGDYELRAMPRRK